MKIEIVEATEDPESLVCKGARNDYRSEGIIDYEIEELLEDAAIEGWAIDEVVNEWGLSLEPSGDDWEESVEELPEDVEREARKRTLLKHLIDSGHWGPFEHPSATISIEGVTRVSMAQITRHRHFTFDIMSLRYVGLEDADVSNVEARFQIPECVKEGEAVDRHEGVIDIHDKAERRFIEAYRDAITHYRELLDYGVPQEEARKVLPMGTKVNITMSGNARAWMHLLNIRGKANVQGEARDIADGVMDEMKEWMPWTFSRYDEEVLPLKLNP